MRTGISIDVTAADRTRLANRRVMLCTGLGGEPELEMAVEEAVVSIARAILASGGQLVARFDGAGLERTREFDHHGNALRSERRVVGDDTVRPFMGN